MVWLSMPRKLTNFLVDPDLLEALRAIREKDGIPIGEQIRRGIKLWLQARGSVKAERKRAGTRKRS
jgi:hypothetical protein